MKTYLKLSVLTVLLMAASSQCFAMMSIGYVSKERAKELGMEIRAQANGPNEVWVELEFKTEGQLKNFSRVDLEIREGKKLLMGYAALKEDRSKLERVVVSFMANRAYLDKITLRVVTGVPGDMAGYELRVKDFVDLEKSLLHPEETPATPPRAKDAGSKSPPAATAPAPIESQRKP